MDVAKIWFHKALVWALAVLLTASVGSIVQTQFNLAAIAALSEPIGLVVRLQVTAQDLLGFMPAWSLVVALALLPAFTVAAGLHRWTQWNRLAWFMVAGVAALASALWLLNSVFPITPIAALRSSAGYWAMVSSGAVGGWFYVRLTT